jgi:hypothetical protein
MPSGGVRPSRITTNPTTSKKSESTPGDPVTVLAPLVQRLGRTARAPGLAEPLLRVSPGLVPRVPVRGGKTRASHVKFVSVSGRPSLVRLGVVRVTVSAGVTVTVTGPGRSVSCRRQARSARLRPVPVLQWVAGLCRRFRQRVGSLYRCPKSALG